MAKGIALPTVDGETTQKAPHIELTNFRQESHKIAFVAHPAAMPRIKVYRSQRRQRTCCIGNPSAIRVLGRSATGARVRRHQIHQSVWFENDGDLWCDNVTEVMMTAHVASMRGFPLIVWLHPAVAGLKV